MALLLFLIEKIKGDPMANINLTVEDIHCKSCKMLITDAVQEAGARNVNVQIDEKKQIGTVACDYAGDIMNIINAIKKEGYKVRK